MLQKEPYFNILFITNNSFAILKRVIKSVFSISPTVSEKKKNPPQNFFILSNFFRGVGVENLMISFPWPYSGRKPIS